MRKNGVSPRVLLTVAACCTLVWWDSFHEIGRFFYADEFFGSSFYGYLSCFMQPAGLATGCAGVLLAAHRHPTSLASGRIVSAVLALEMLLHVSYYGSVSILAAPLAACMLHFLISACFAMNSAYVLVLFSRLGTKAVVRAAIVCVLCMGPNCLAFSLAVRAVPLAVIGFVYGAVLLAAFLAVRACGARVADEADEERHAAPVPLPLMFHLAAYGFVFGVLHSLSGSLVTGPLSINMPSFFSYLLTAAILAVLFFWKKGETGSNTEIWSKLRSTVFPLAVIGFMLIPLVPNSNIALAVIGAGQILYEAMLAIACVVFIGRTFVAPVVIVSFAFFFKSAGMAAGIGCAAFTGVFDMAHSSEGLAAIGVLLTLLLTAATFWVGSDESIRKIWGLRKNLSPKRYADTLLRARCAKLSVRGRLTAKESEVLFMVAQGRRASEIKDEMHVSINTVRSHIQHAYAKLDVHSVDELMALVKSVVVEDRDIE